MNDIVLYQHKTKTQQSHFKHHDEYLSLVKISATVKSFYTRSLYNLYDLHYFMNFELSITVLIKTI